MHQISRRSSIWLFASVAVLVSACSADLLGDSLSREQPMHGDLRDWFTKLANFHESAMREARGGSSFANPSSSRDDDIDEPVSDKPPHSSDRFEFAARGAQNQRSPSHEFVKNLVTQLARLRADSQRMRIPNLYGKRSAAFS